MVLLNGISPKTNRGNLMKDILRWVLVRIDSTESPPLTSRAKIVAFGFLFSNIRIEDVDFTSCLSPIFPWPPPHIGANVYSLPR